MAKITDVNLISIGAWNPAILQPQWLLKELPHLIKQQTIGIDIVAGTTGTSSAFRMQFDKFSLDPNGGRLFLVPKEYDETTLKYVSDIALDIIEKLQYTPISAAGSNITFALDENELLAIDENKSEDNLDSLYSSLGNDFNVIAKGVRHTLSGENCRININYDYQDNDRTVRVNFDYQPPKNPLREAANQFVNNFHTATEIVNTLIGSN